MTSFGFADWPFTNVPTPERAVNLWADRSKAQEQIEDILDEWVSTKRSTITLLWADLGSGKTHTLLNLVARCKHTGTIAAFYVLLPTAITDFLGLYRAITKEIDWAAVGAVLPATNRAIVRNIRNAITWLNSDTDNVRSNIAQRWLSGEKIRASECQMIGVSAAIVTPEEAVDTLAAAINAIVSSGKRVVLMIDEYQRVAEGKRTQLQKIGHGIHTLYNACASNFSLVLSCATGMSDDFTMVLTPEVVSRLSPKRIDLPYLSIDDIITYIRELFLHYRASDAQVPNPFWPLSQRITQEFASFLMNGLNGETTPRRINEAFGQLLSFLRRSKGPTADLTQREFEEWLQANGSELLRRVG